MSDVRVSGPAQWDAALQAVEPFSLSSRAQGGLQAIVLKATRPKGSECISIKGYFLGSCARGYYGHDVEPVHIAAESESGDELVRRRLQPLALLPVHELPGLAKCRCCPGLDLHEDQRFSLERNDIDLAPAGAISTSENVEPEVEKMPAGDAFTESAGQNVRCRHTSNVSAEAPLFRVKVLSERVSSGCRRAYPRAGCPLREASPGFCPIPRNPCASLPATAPLSW